MATLSKIKNALSFAHLASLGRAKVQAEDGKPTPADDDKKTAKAKAAAKAKAEDDEKEPDAQDESEDESADGDVDTKPGDDAPSETNEGQDADDGDEGESDEDKKKAKAKAKAKAEDDKKEDDELNGTSATAKARLREQARCASIFASAAAGKNPVLAANLAFTTRLSSSAAIRLLESTPVAAQAAPAHADRAARNPSLGANVPALTGKQALASRWDARFKKANS